MDNVFQQISEAIRNAYDKGVLGWMVLFSIPIIFCCVLYAVGIMAERAAQNMPIQGTEADLMKRAMTFVDKKLPEGAKLVLQIHDSLVVECDQGDEEVVKMILQKEMEGVAPELKIKLKVEVTAGQNLGEL